MVELIHIDCMEYLKNIPNKWFSLAVVDVNYGIKQDGRTNHTRGGKISKSSKMSFHSVGTFVPSKDYRQNYKYDDSAPGEEYFEELFRASQNQIIFGANHFISKIPIDSPCWLVWDKRNDGNDFSDCELAWTSFDTAVRIFRHKWNGMLQENMNNREKRIHPNHKPIALYAWLLKNYAKPGDKILDTHLGSGSSAIAAHKLGFDFVGCEIDKDYFDAALKRYKKETAMPLFDNV